MGLEPGNRPSTAAAGTRIRANLLQPAASRPPQLRPGQLRGAAGSASAAPSARPDTAGQLHPRPGTAARGGALRPGSAAVFRERSLPRLTAELASDCETWSGQFNKALTSVEALVEATETGRGAATDGAQGRRQSEMMSLLRLVGDRLGTASTQVQHTRGQAAALTQMHEKLVACEKEQARLREVADEAREAEQRARDETSLLRAELAAVELAGARAAAAATRGQQAAAAAEEAAARAAAASAPAPAARAAPDELEQELSRLRKVADHEMCARFDLMRELEAAKKGMEQARREQAQARRRGGGKEGGCSKEGGGCEEGAGAARRRGAERAAPKIGGAGCGGWGGGEGLAEADEAQGGRRPATASMALPSGGASRGRRGGEGADAAAGGGSAVTALWAPTSWAQAKTWDPSRALTSS